jgi:hypothetical protein
MSKIEEKRIGGSVLRLKFCGMSFARKYTILVNCLKLSYIIVTLSKMVDRTCHFSIGRIYASMNASLKSKSNESEEVYFG